MSLRPVATNDNLYQKNYASIMPNMKIADFKEREATEVKERIYRVPACLELTNDGECTLQSRILVKKKKKAGLSNGAGGTVRLNPILDSSMKRGGNKGEENQSKKVEI